MLIHEFGNIDAPVLVLIPGTYTSWQIFSKVIDLLQTRFRIVVLALDGQQTDLDGKPVPNKFTSVDDQARQIEEWLQTHANGQVDTVYGISLGGSIAGRLAERNGVQIRHLIMDAAPITSFGWAMRHFSAGAQMINIWCICHFKRLYRAMFRSHYYHALFDEFDRTYPCDGTGTARRVFPSVFAYRLQSLPKDMKVQFWYGSKEILFPPQARHAQQIYPTTQVRVFPKMNHAQLLTDYPEKVAQLLEA